MMFSDALATAKYLSTPGEPESRQLIWLQQAAWNFINIGYNEGEREGKKKTPAFSAGAGKLGRSCQSPLCNAALATII